ncbi:MAG: YdcF family protein [Lachnospiraceae bacterium]|nr:YdcF family protein [Lachnospiraceae bacterium]
MIRKICIIAGLLVLVLAGCTDKEASNNEKPVVVLDDFGEVDDNMDPELLQAEINQCVLTIISDNVRKPGSVQVDIDKLAALDQESADRWAAIIKYWNDANEKEFINKDILPDGLPDDNSLCIVVLGYQLNADGTMKDELIGRLETALDNADKYPNAYILVTGGGTASANSSATEADCMAEWLIENGIAEDKVIIENMSKTTAENALFSYAILDRDYPEVSSIAIVTSDYHIPLGCMLFNSELMLDRNKNIGDIAVVANSAYDADVVGGFSMSSQADWLNHLYGRQ